MSPGSRGNVRGLDVQVFCERRLKLVLARPWHLLAVPQPLKQSLSKTLQIKLGMIQQALLTGKTRLAKPTQKESTNV
ncbi:MAG: hypothetical protein CTY29_00995 [Methylobacter sp.]|nr:MAG: hypothetical protein CTY29_00995 [Methylobacter sp.]